MRRIWLSVFIFMLSVMVPDGGRAFSAAPETGEGAVLFVAPHRLIVRPEEKVSVIGIANRSKEARRYDLTVVDQAMGPNGVTERVETFPYSIKRMIKFTPRRFSLEPGERQTVRVSIERPKDLADGDYHSHLLFREVPLTVKDKAQLEAERIAAQKEKKVASFEIRTLYGIGVPVIVQHGKIVSDIAMGDISLGETPDGKKHLMAIDFLRSGNAEAAAKLSAEYVRGSAPPVAIIEPQWIRLYHEVDKVTKIFSLNLPAGAAGGKIIISLAKDEGDSTRTIKKEIAFN